MKFCQMALKSAVNCLCTILLNGDHNMIMVGWMEIIQNFDYFLIKFNDFDQINIGRVTF